MPGERYRFRIRARAMIDKTGPNARPSDAARPDRRIMLQVGLAEWPRTGLTSDRVYFEASPTEFHEFEYVARVPKGKTLWVHPYRAVPEEADERAMLHGLCAVIEWVEITGPLVDEWPPRGHRLLYADLPLEPVDPKQPGKDLRVVSPDPEQDARRLLAGFLPRAFRRPVTDAEIEKHVALVREELGKGSRFDEALRAAYTLALCSPHFLFRSERPGPLDDHALASRLSYGFWATAPDEELTALAAAGRLRDPAVLVAQTRRLIDHPRRGKRFTVNLLDNWLKLRDIDFTQPDTKLYPEFEEYLKRSMLSESIVNRVMAITSAFWEDGRPRRFLWLGGGCGHLEVDCRRLGWQVDRGDVVGKQRLAFDALADRDSIIAADADDMGSADRAHAGIGAEPASTDAAVAGGAGVARRRVRLERDPSHGQRLAHERHPARDGVSRRSVAPVRTTARREQGDEHNRRAPAQSHRPGGHSPPLLALPLARAPKAW